MRSLVRFVPAVPGRCRRSNRLACAVREGAEVTGACARSLLNSSLSPTKARVAPGLTGSFCRWPVVDLHPGVL